MPDEVSGGLLLSLSLLWCYHNSIDYCLSYFSFAILPHPLPLYLILQDLEGHSPYKDQTAP